MSTDKTTIQITGDQKDRLEDIKASDGEPMHGVIQRLLDGHEADGDDEIHVARIREIIRDEVRPEALR